MAKRFDLLVQCDETISLLRSGRQIVLGAPSRYKPQYVPAAIACQARRESAEFEAQVRQDEGGGWRRPQLASLGQR